jgi:hypothetical protein
MAHNGVALEFLGSIDKILPHEVLREGEGREHDLLGHLEALDPLHVLADDLPDLCNLHARSQSRQVALEFRYLQIKVPPNHLEKRRIDPCVVLMER